MIAQTVSADRIEIQFECPTVGCEALIDDLIQPAQYDASKPVDEAVGHLENFVTCPSCNGNFVVDAYSTMLGNYFTVRDHSDVWVRDVAQTDYYDDFDVDPPLTDPVEVYLQARRNLETFYDQQPIDLEYDRTFNSMVFTQYVTLMEAYLGDRIAGLVFEHADRLTALVRATESLRKAQISLVELANEPDILRLKVKQFFQNFSFHNIEKVAKLYKATLSVDIIPDPAKAERLIRLVHLRHDLVHRNGKDRDGNVSDLTADHIKEIAALSDEVVSRVEAKYNEFRARFFFEDSNTQADKA